MSKVQVGGGGGFLGGGGGGKGGGGGGGGLSPYSPSEKNPVYIYIYIYVYIVFNIYIHIYIVCDHEITRAMQFAETVFQHSCINKNLGNFIELLTVTSGL